MEGSGSVTIKNVAIKAGVSVSTVSCVLRDAPNVSDAVKKRVRKIMKDMGYVPNRMARGMVGGRTYSVACCFPGWRWFETESNRHEMEGVGERLEEEGYTLHLLRLRDDGNEIEVLRRFYLANRFDGAILIGPWLQSVSASKLHKVPVPCVVMNSPAAGPDVSGVLLDEETGGYLAARHLVERGHRRAAVLGPLDMPHYGQLRLQGFQRALHPEAQGGARLEKVLSFKTTRFLCPPEEVFALVERALTAKVTAIFCLSDHLAMQVYDAAAALRVKVPRDLSVIGFDNSEASRLMRPALTTIETPGLEIGRLTAKMIMEFVRDPALTSQRVMLPARLVVRDSVQLLA